MKRIIILLASFTAITVFSVSAAVVLPSDKSKFHIFVMMGQSNMAGLGGVIEPQDTVTKPHIVKFWPIRNAGGGWVDFNGDLRTFTGEWVGGRDPVGPDQWNPNAGVGTTGLSCGMSFAQQVLSRDTSVTIGLINIAVSGSALLPWTKGGQYYNANLAIIRAAMASGTLKGLLWHQGEAGTGCSGCSYSTMYKQMIADYRADLGVPDMAVIAGQLGITGDAGGTNAELASVAGQITRMTVTSSATFTLYDNVHYDAQSQRLMGIRMAQAWIRMNGDNTNLPLVITSTRYGAPRGKPFQGTLQADNGGTDPIVWSLVTALPAGISLAASAISGTPTAATGKYTVTVRAQRTSGAVQKDVVVDVSVPVAFSRHVDTVTAPIGRTTHYTLPVANSSYEPLKYRWFSFPSFMRWDGPWNGDSSIMHFTPAASDTSFSMKIWAGAGDFNNNWDSLNLRCRVTPPVSVHPGVKTVQTQKYGTRNDLYAIDGQRVSRTLKSSPALYLSKGAGRVPAVTRMVMTR